MSAPTKPLPTNRLAAVEDRPCAFPEPHDIEAEETLAFVSPHLPRQSCRLLEIGDGGQSSARRFAESGHEIHVVNPTGRPHQASELELLSVESVQPDSLQLKSFGYDAVVVSNTVHHFHDLDGLLKRIGKSLVSLGLLFVDEADHSILATNTTDWYRRTLSELRSRGYIELSTDHDLERAVFAGQNIAEYFEQRGQATHSALDLRLAMREQFSVQSDARTPFLYRYFSNMVPSGEPGARLVRSFLELESAAIEQGSLEAPGRRIIAIKNQ